jgi:hypothetical protein
MNARDDRHGLIEEGDYGLAKTLRGKLHLSELVDQDDGLRTGLAHRGQRHPLESVQVDTVTPNSGRPVQVDVGQDAAVAFECFDLETDTGTTLA